MPFAVYMIGFLFVMAVLVFAAVVLGVPQQYLAIGVGVIVAAFIAVVVSRARAREQRLDRQGR
jgi:Flp pilus assembly protein TadB